MVSLNAGESFGFEEYIKKNLKRKFSVECSNQGIVYHIRANEVNKFILSDFLSMRMLAGIAKTREQYLKERL